jgi:hypothetical protein
MFSLSGTKHRVGPAFLSLDVHKHNSKPQPCVCESMSELNLRIVERRGGKMIAKKAQRGS